MATVCQQDKSVKIFDVENFDMINILRFDFAPRAACWIHQGICSSFMRVYLVSIT